MVAAAPSEQQIRKCVRRLGSPKFSIREDATQKLLGCGWVALPILEVASQSGDREVRDRSRRIIALIRVRRRADRLEAFKAGRPMDAALGYLPGWRSFSKSYGDNRESRQVFSEMLESEWSLLKAIYSSNESPSPVRRLLAERLYRLQLQGYRKYSMGTMLSIYVIAADFPDDVSIHRQLSGFCLQHPELRAALNSTARRPLVRKIVGAWVAAASRLSVNVDVCLLTAMRFQLPEGTIAAERALENAATTLTIKNRAMQALAKLGDKSKSRILEPLLEDATVLRGNAKRKRQIRDVALACLMYMHGHDVSKIGVRIATTSTHELFEYNSLGFDSDAEREQAMQHWLAIKAGSDKD